MKKQTLIILILLFFVVAFSFYNSKKITTTDVQIGEIKKNLIKNDIKIDDNKNNSINILPTSTPSKNSLNFQPTPLPPFVIKADVNINLKADQVNLAPTIEPTIIPAELAKPEIYFDTLRKQLKDIKDHKLTNSTVDTLQIEREKNLSNENNDQNILPENNPQDGSIQDEPQLYEGSE